MFDKLKRFAAIYAFIFAWALPLSAIALTPAQRVVLFSGGVKPTATLNFATQTYTGSCASFSSCVSFSRAGNAMQYYSNGLLGWAAVNEYINSTNGSNTARTSTTQVGVNYYLWCQASTGTATIVATGTASFTLTCTTGGASNTFTATAGTLTLTPTSNFANISQAVLGRYTFESSFPRSQDNVTTGASAFYGARNPDYNPATLAALGLLVEGSATNVALQSNTFSSASWTKVNVSAAQNAPGPDGLSTSGWTITASAGAANHWFYQAITSGNYTGSIIAKAGTANYIALGFGSGALIDGAFFNLLNGTIGTVQSGTIATITNLGNGFYRCTAYRAGVTFNAIEPHTTDAQPVSWTAAGTENIIVYGAQSEVNPFATSYIPTGASSVTRAADIAQLTGPALTLVKQSSFSLIAQVLLEGVPAGAPRIVDLGSGVGAPLLLVANNSGTTYNNSVVLTTATGTPLWTSTARLAAAGSASGRSVVFNGGVVTTDANAFTGGTASAAYLGSQNGTGQFLYGWINQLALYNSTLPNATLKSKSIVGSAY